MVLVLHQGTRDFLTSYGVIMHRVCIRRQVNVELTYGYTDVVNIECAFCVKFNTAVLVVLSCKILCDLYVHVGVEHNINVK